MAYTAHITSRATARAPSEKSTRAQFLSLVMSDAWAISRAREIPFGDALKEAWAHSRATAAPEPNAAEVAIRNLAEAIDRFIASTTAAELPETADLAHTATLVLDILDGDPDLEPDDEHDEDGHDAEAWSDDNGIGDREGLLEQTARHQALMRRRARERSGDGR